MAAGNDFPQVLNHAVTSTGKYYIRLFLLVGSGNIDYLFGIFINDVEVFVDERTLSTQLHYIQPFHVDLDSSIVISYSGPAQPVHLFPMCDPICEDSDLIGTPFFTS